MDKTWLDRTAMLIGAEGVDRLKNSSVCVFGVGGVGGYVCEMLARAGVGTITIVDFDVVDVTNINRQIIANFNTIGKLKCDVMEEHLKTINPEIKIYSKKIKFDESSLDICFENKYNYVVDAIDMVKSKTLLITHCIKNNIPVISAMGAGNRTDIPKFEVVDIFKTFNDGLAKVMRKQLKDNGIEKHICVCSNTKSVNNNSGVGSISYYPAMAGCVLASYVINNLIKGE